MKPLPLRWMLLLGMGMLLLEVTQGQLTCATAGTDGGNFDRCVGGTAYDPTKAEVDCVDETTCAISCCTQSSAEEGKRCSEAGTNGGPYDACPGAYVYLAAAAEAVCSDQTTPCEHACCRYPTCYNSDGLGTHFQCPENTTPFPDYDGNCGNPEECLANCCPQQAVKCSEAGAAGGAFDGCFQGTIFHPQSPEASCFDPASCDFFCCSSPRCTNVDGSGGDFVCPDGYNPIPDSLALCRDPAECTTNCCERRAVKCSEAGTDGGVFNQCGDGMVFNPSRGEDGCYDQATCAYSCCTYPTCTNIDGLGGDFACPEGYTAPYGPDHPAVCSNPEECISNCCVPTALQCKAAGASGGPFDQCGEGLVYHVLSAEESCFDQASCSFSCCTYPRCTNTDGLGGQFQCPEGYVNPYGPDHQGICTNPDECTRNCCKRSPLKCSEAGLSGGPFDQCPYGLVYEPGYGESVCFDHASCAYSCCTGPTCPNPDGSGVAFQCPEGYTAFPDYPGRCSNPDECVSNCCSLSPIQCKAAGTSGGSFDQCGEGLVYNPSAGESSCHHQPSCSYQCCTYPSCTNIDGVGSDFQCPQGYTPYLDSPSICSNPTECIAHCCVEGNPGVVTEKKCKEAGTSGGFFDQCTGGFVYEPGYGESLCSDQESCAFSCCTYPYCTNTDGLGGHYQCPEGYTAFPDYPGMCGNPAECTASCCGQTPVKCSEAGTTGGTFDQCAEGTVYNPMSGEDSCFDERTCKYFCCEPPTCTNVDGLGGNFQCPDGYIYPYDHRAICTNPAECVVNCCAQSAMTCKAAGSSGGIFDQCAEGLVYNPSSGDDGCFDQASCRYTCCSYPRCTNTDGLGGHFLCPEGYVSIPDNPAICSNSAECITNCCHRSLKKCSEAGTSGGIFDQCAVGLVYNPLSGEDVCSDHASCSYSCCSYPTCTNTDGFGGDFSCPEGYTAPYGPDHHAICSNPAECTRNCCVQNAGLEPAVTTEKKCKEAGTSGGFYDQCTEGFVYEPGYGENLCSDPASCAYSCCISPTCTNTDGLGGDFQCPPGYSLHPDYHAACTNPSQCTTNCCYQSATKCKEAGTSGGIFDQCAGGNVYNPLAGEDSCSDPASCAYFCCTYPSCTNIDGLGGDYQCPEGYTLLPDYPAICRNPAECTVNCCTRRTTLCSEAGTSGGIFDQCAAGTVYNPLAAEHVCNDQASCAYSCCTFPSCTNIDGLGGDFQCPAGYYAPYGPDHPAICGNPEECTNNCCVPNPIKCSEAGTSGGIFDRCAAGTVYNPLAGNSTCSDQPSCAYHCCTYPSCTNTDGLGNDFPCPQGYTPYPDSPAICSNPTECTTNCCYRGRPATAGPGAGPAAGRPGPGGPPTRNRTSGGLRSTTATGDFPSG